MSKKIEHRLLGLRIFNQSRTKVLLRRYKRSKVWAFPTIPIGLEGDPLPCIWELLNTTLRSKDWELISAIPILETERAANADAPNSVIYDILYRGEFLDASQSADLPTDFDDATWIGCQSSFDNVRPMNIPTKDALDAMTKDKI